jgi:hypothetical protein
MALAMSGVDRDQILAVLLEAVARIERANPR